MAKEPIREPFVPTLIRDNGKPLPRSIDDVEEQTFKEVEAIPDDEFDQWMRSIGLPVDDN